jgi:hypothetical protein
MDGMIPCSATHLSALKEQKHLKMGAVPDTGVMDHLVDHHKTTSQQLSAMCAAVPGLADAPAGTEMSHISGYVSGLHNKMERIHPHSANMSAVDYERGLSAKLEQLSASSEAISAKDETIKSQAGEITKLQKQVIEPVTKREAALSLSTIRMMGEQAIKAGYPPVFVNAAIELAGTLDKPNNLMLSAAAYPEGDGVKGPIFRFFELMLMGRPSGNLGVELSAYQGVHRDSPGTGMNAETRAAQDKHFGKTAAA